MAWAKAKTAVNYGGGGDFGGRNNHPHHHSWLMDELIQFSFTTELTDSDNARF